MSSDGEYESYCTVCGETWDDYYDAVSHVYTSHDVCGTPPEWHVETREKIEV